MKHYVEDYIVKSRSLNSFKTDKHNTFLVIRLADEYIPSNPYLGAIRTIQISKEKRFQYIKKRRRRILNDSKYHKAIDSISSLNNIVNSFKRRVPRILSNGVQLSLLYEDDKNKTEYGVGIL